MHYVLKLLREYTANIQVSFIWKLSKFLIIYLRILVYEPQWIQIDWRWRILPKARIWDLRWQRLGVYGEMLMAERYSEALRVNVTRYWNTIDMWLHMFISFLWIFAKKYCKSKEIKNTYIIMIQQFHIQLSNSIITSHVTP